MTTRHPPSRVATEALLACGNCGQVMQQLSLAGHYGRPVVIDLCAGCHLVWFDLTETARLSGPALLELIGVMAGSQTLPHEVLHGSAHCARCRSGLKTVHNRSRWGQSLQLECLARHGAYQSFAQFLQEKGLLRPMSRLDRAQLLQDAGRIDCVNCGAAIQVDDTQCRYCESVPSLLDVARLARALDPEGALEPQAVHGTGATASAMQCAACGAALPPERALGCAQCGATLAISSLARAHESVAALGPALRAHAQRPAPDVVKRRMAALDTDLPRHRAWAQQMQAEVDRQRGTAHSEWELGNLAQTHPLRAVLIALVIWFVWWWW